MKRDLLADIVRRIVETAQPEKIILFGSRARGDAVTRPCTWRWQG